MQRKNRLNQSVPTHLANILSCRLLAVIHMGLYLSEITVGGPKRSNKQMLSLNEKNQITLPIHIRNFPNTWKLHF